MSALRIGLIGGTGLAEALSGAQPAGQRHEIRTPFGLPGDAIIETRWAGVPVLLLSRHGPGHLLNPSQVPYRANIFALKMLGCTHILASGAVGSLRDEYRPRDLVIPDQLIDRTTRRASTFFEKAAVHVEFAEPFCPVLRQIVLEAGQQNSEFRVQNSESARIHPQGCYVAMEGPAFSTRAESLMHRLWGGDLIGMTALPEAKLAREAEIPYVLMALVTDYDCWKLKAAPANGTDAARPEGQALLKEIISNMQAATNSALDLMKRSVEVMAARESELEHCPASRALELAIWSDKTRIEPAEIERLRPLWGRYF